MLTMKCKIYQKHVDLFAINLPYLLDGVMTHRLSSYKFLTRASYSAAWKPWRKHQVGLDSNLDTDIVIVITIAPVPLESIIPGSNIAHVALDGSILYLCSSSSEGRWSLTKLLVNPTSLAMVYTTPLVHDVSFATTISTASQQKYLVLGTHKPSICVYSVDDLSRIHEEPLANVSTAGTNIPESCSFLDSQSSSFLVVGLRDGTLVSYPLDSMIGN